LSINQAESRTDCRPTDKSVEYLLQNVIDILHFYVIIYINFIFIISPVYNFVISLYNIL